MRRVTTTTTVRTRMRSPPLHSTRVTPHLSNSWRPPSAPLLRHSLRALHAAITATAAPATVVRALASHEPHILAAGRTAAVAVLGASLHEAAATALAPGFSNTAALTQTVWGGGSAGNTPSNTNGLLGTASLSSAGPTAWMGSSTFNPSTSDFLLVDSGHPAAVKKYNAQSLTGLTTYISSVTQSPCAAGVSTVKAVVTDNSTNVWLVDASCGNVVYYRTSTSAFTTVMSSLPIDPTLPVSLVINRANTFLYLGFSSSILRVPPTCKNTAVNCTAYRQTSLVAGSTAVSNLTLSFNEQWLYFIDAQGIKNISALLPLTSYPNTATTLITCGTGQLVVNPTAIAMSPDGAGLVIADYLPAGYTQIKYLNLSTLAVTTIGPNNVQSNCSVNSPTYQNGWIGGPACWGVIHQIITGTGSR